MSLDMATALELTLDDESEAKFLALKTLSTKKLKSLMTSIDAKDREIAKLKILGKDNRRAQMIQELRKKIRVHEVINDLLKEELQRRVEMSTEESNALIIRKTLAGPKRFRPLSREELENKIIELEKKVSKKPPVGGSSVHNGNDTSMMDADAKTDGRPSTAQSRQSQLGTAEGKDLDNMSFTGGQGSGPGSNKGGGGGGGGGGSAEDYGKLMTLIEEIDDLKRTLAAKENVLDLQREEIVRLKSRNAQLISVEEDIEFNERKYRDIQSENDALNSSLQDTTRKLAEALELSLKMKSEITQEKENKHMENASLQKECEKVLKQNSALLQQVSALEVELDQTAMDVNMKTSSHEASMITIRNKDDDIKALQERLQRTEDKLSACENKVERLEKVAAQVPLLKDQLREKNIALKELKRNLDERDRLTKQQLRSIGGSADSKHAPDSPVLQRAGSYNCSDSK